MHDVAHPEIINFERSEENETKVISTELEFKSVIRVTRAGKKVIIVKPAYDFGGGSCTALVRVKERS